MYMFPWAIFVVLLMYYLKFSHFCQFAQATRHDPALLCFFFLFFYFFLLLCFHVSMHIQFLSCMLLIFFLFSFRILCPFSLFIVTIQNCIWCDGYTNSTWYWRRMMRDDASCQNSKRESEPATNNITLCEKSNSRRLCFWFSACVKTTITATIATATKWRQ